MQSQGKFWTVGKVRNLIEQRYAVRYGKRQVQRLLRQLGMYCYKPQPRDYRQSAKAEEQLAERLQAVADVLGLWNRDLSKICIGFADECAGQLQSNNQRLWSFEKALTKAVNTDRKKVNSFGFYALKGKSVISKLAKGNEENLLKVLPLIKEANPEAETIILIWDNHSAHLTKAIEGCARQLGIILVNLPAYSPNLNPIERIWKMVKQTISEQGYIRNIQQLEHIIQECFQACSKKLSFAESWIEKFWNQIFQNHPIPYSAKL
jgi:transposase